MLKPLRSNYQGHRQQVVDRLFVGRFVTSMPSPSRREPSRSAIDTWAALRDRLASAICASRLWRATSVGNCPSVNTWKWRGRPVGVWFSSLEATDTCPTKGKRVWSPPFEANLGSTGHIRLLVRWPGALRAPAWCALTSRSFVAQRAVQRNALSVPPRVCGKTCRPTSHRAVYIVRVNRLDSRKVSFHVSHSFRSEEAQFWIKRTLVGSQIPMQSF